MPELTSTLVKRYGAYSKVSRKFVFGITETSKAKARKKLFQKIGKDANKYRFEFKVIKEIKPKKTTQRRTDNMTNQQPSTRIVTGEVRFSFVSLLKPRESQFGGDAKYGVTILLPKTDVETKQRIDAAIEAAKQRGKAEKWNGVIPPTVAVPIHDGDGVKPSDGMPFGDECKGHWVFTASTGLDYPPKIVDVAGNPIIDHSEVYSGMYGRIALNFNPYSYAGKKGIGVYISTNVQKTRDGEPLSGSAPAAADDFGLGGGAGQAPHQQFNQAPPQYQQQPPVQQGYQQPPAQQGYQAPPAQQQQYQAPPQQQFDPITGQPLNGGVYGI
jgi:Protein of unknown function (DUF2815)